MNLRGKQLQVCTCFGKLQFTRLRTSHFTARKLAEYDLAICRAFAFKVRANLTDKAFKMLPFAFPQEPPLPTLDGVRSRINFLAGFKPQIYDCCVNSCLCFVGPHKDLKACIYCKEPRYRANGKP
ncbi:hypothetical protein B0H16DRAFT_1312851, partial [Mycena metata]